MPALGNPNGGTISLATTSDYPLFLWTPAPGATSYTFQLYASDGVTVLATTNASLVTVGCPSNVGACGGYYVYPYVNGTTYRWSVRAENSSGVSTYATPQPFTVVYTGSSTPIPAPPVLGNPAGNISTLTPMYLWTPSAGATSYTLGVWNGSTQVIAQALSLSQAGCPTNAGACGYTPPAALTSGTTYTWAVSAGNSAGQSPYSATASFHTP
jgi:hypothetical protein